MASSSSRAFAIQELFEMIVLAPTVLTVRGLMHCRHVCTNWRATIDGSLRVKQRMHMASSPASKSYPTICDTLPSCMTKTRFEIRNEMGLIGDEKDQCLVIEIAPPAVKNLDLEQLSKVLFLQPAYKLRNVEVRGNGHLWYYDCDFSSDTVVTLGAFVAAAQQALDCHVGNCAMCLECECSNDKYSSLSLFAYASPLQDDAGSYTSRAVNFTVEEQYDNCGYEPDRNPELIPYEYRSQTKALETEAGEEAEAEIEAKDDAEDSEGEAVPAV